MILKTLTHRGKHGVCDCWNFYDKIEAASVYFDDDANETCIDIRFSNGENETLIVLDEMYLLNDSGRTIEKIRPKINVDISSENSNTIAPLIM